MTQERAYGLAEVSRLLGVPQHRLIHLCEKGVVEPELADASGRGSSRRFSERNVFEFALALRLKEQLVPLASARVILYVLRQFEKVAAKEIAGFRLPDSLRGGRAPDLRVILGDSEKLFVSLAPPGKPPRVFGGVDLGGATGAGKRRVALAKATRPRHDPQAFGWPEGSRYSRAEVNVTQIARDLPLG